MKVWTVKQHILTRQNKLDSAFLAHNVFFFSDNHKSEVFEEFRISAEFLSIKCEIYEQETLREYLDTKTKSFVEIA